MTFERFTERAREVFTLAKTAAVAEGETHVGIRHILIGLTTEEDGLAARLLHDLGASWTLKEGIPGDASKVTFGLQANAVMELALREALSLGHNYIGTEHILLAVLRDPEGQALMLHALPDVDVRRLVLDRVEGHKVYGKRPKPKPVTVDPDALASVRLAVEAARTSLDLAESLLKAL